MWLLLQSAVLLLFSEFAFSRRFQLAPACRTLFIHGLLTAERCSAFISLHIPGLILRFSLLTCCLLSEKLLQSSICSVCTVLLMRNKRNIIIAYRYYIASLSKFVVKIYVILVSCAVSASAFILDSTRRWRLTMRVEPSSTRAAWLVSLPSEAIARFNCSGCLYE